MGIRISKDHLHPSVIESITSLIGDLNQLETTAKGNAVEAINELLANGGNKEELEALIAEIAEGKELIANAVGEPLTAEESFNEMSNDINGLLSTFKTNMMNNGIVVEANDRFKSLIDKIANLSNNENNSIQYAKGSATQVKITTIQSDGIHVDVDFVPTLVFIEFRNRTTPLHPESSYNTGEGFIGILAIHATDDGVPWCINFGAQMYAGTYSSYHYNVFFNKGLTDGSLITIEKLDLSSSSWIYGSPAVDYTWYAMGIKGDILLLDKGNEYNKLVTGGSWTAGGIELIEGTGLVFTPDTSKYKISTFKNRIDLSKYSSFEFTVNCPSGTNGIWVIADTVVRGGTYAEPVADTATEIAKFENNPTEKTFKVDLTGVNDLAYFGLAFMPSSNSETYQVTNMKLITNDGSSENTALRDSLADILQEEGVSVTEEDTMASLITKVDEEFDKRLIPAVCTNGVALPLHSYTFEKTHNSNTPTDYEIGYTFFNGYVTIGYSWYTPNNTYGLSHLTFISKDKDGNIIHTSETFDDNTGFPSYYENIKVVYGGKLFARVDTFGENVYKRLNNIVLYCNNIEF